jgi:hypothetical protein
MSRTPSATSSSPHPSTRRDSAPVDEQFVDYPVASETASSGIGTGRSNRVLGRCTVCRAIRVAVPVRRSPTVFRWRQVGEIAAGDLQDEAGSSPDDHGDRREHHPVPVPATGRAHRGAPAQLEQGAVRPVLQHPHHPVRALARRLDVEGDAPDGLDAQRPGQWSREPGSVVLVPSRLGSRFASRRLSIGLGEDFL